MLLLGSLLLTLSTSNAGDDPCQLLGTDIVVVEQDEQGTRGALVECTPEELSILSAGSNALRKIPRASVRSVVPMLASPSGGEGNEAARTLAPSAGLLLPGIGQLVGGKPRLGAGLMVLGLAGLGTAATTTVLFAGGNISSDDETEFIALLSGGAALWLGAYVFGVVDAFSSDAPLVVAPLAGPINGAAVALRW